MIYVRNALFFVAASLVVILLLCGAEILWAEGIGPAAPVHAKLLLGLPGMDANSEGELIVSPSAVRFESAQGHADIVRRSILSVSSGEERIETGGAAGRIARVAIPYGGGLALGAVTHKKISMLTIEYLDAGGQYRGAVFLVTPDDLAGPLQPLSRH